MSAPVENIVSRLHAKRAGKGWLAKCPAHDDRDPSLTINEGADGRALVYCQAGCPLEAVLSALGLTKKDLFPQSVLPKSRGNRGPSLRSQSLDWQSCVDAFTEEHLERLAKWRGYSVEFCSWLKQNGFVGLYDGCIGFPVQDHTGKTVAVHYRRKDGSWRYYPQGTKVRPLVVRELIAGEPVHIFESQWCGFDYLDKSGERNGVIVTRGASNGALVAGLIPEGSTAYLWTQNDSAGEKWQKDICTNTKAAIKRVKIPTPYKDLNDWTRAGATVDELAGAVLKAEIVRPVEKSWNDALNESVVTASELHSLKLKPRQKLLGDWFCEGDLGFIFAFRGTGKTWLSLAIAHALSNGGQLGDWQAPAAVKVLYIDGEMPPDLMRDRCDGLQGNNG